MLTYHPIDSVSSEELLGLLNDEGVRRHLTPHDVFTETSVLEWAQSKATEDDVPGCRVRAIRQGSDLAGWCGIQRHDGQYELAMVLAPAYWSCGAEVLQTMRLWATELGHSELFIHLPQSRPQQRAIAKLLGSPVAQTEIAGCAFNTYRLQI